MAEQDYVHMPTLEEYSERFKRLFKFDFDTIEYSDEKMAEM